MEYHTQSVVDHPTHSYENNRPLATLFMWKYIMVSPLEFWRFCALDFSYQPFEKEKKPNCHQYTLQKTQIGRVASKRIHFCDLDILTALSQANCEYIVRIKRGVCSWMTNVYCIYSAGETQDWLWSMAIELVRTTEQAKWHTCRF